MATARMMRLTTMTTEAATTAKIGIASTKIDSPDRNETARTSAHDRFSLPMSELRDPETHCSCGKSATVSGRDSATACCNVRMFE